MERRVVVITGSRDWTLEQPIYSALDGADMLIVGDATGADSIAFECALRRGVIVVMLCASPSRAARARRRLQIHQQIGSVAVVSDWELQRGKAGPIRNSAIVARAVRERERGADVRCFAAPLLHSVGTQDCVSKLRKAGFDVTILEAA